MTAKVFEAALGIADPWSVASVDFDEAAKVLTVLIDFKPGSRFAISGHEGVHPVHDTLTKTYRHMNFFQHECVLQVRTPRVKLPNGSVRLVEPDFAGRLSGFTLLFEAFILMLAQQMPFAAVARLVGESAYRVMAVCERYVEIALGLADFSDVKALAIDETSRARGHDYVTLAADAVKRRVLFVTEGRDAKTIEELAAHLDDHGCPPEQIDSETVNIWRHECCVSLDMTSITTETGSNGHTGALFEGLVVPLDGAAAPKRSTPTGAPRVQSAVRNQVELRACDLDAALPGDHQARCVWAFVQSLDLQALYAQIRAVEGGVGRAPIDPAILMSLWLYATLDGVGSAREIDRLCDSDDAYRWLCGGVGVNHHTLGDFRVEHEKWLDGQLTRNVAALMSQGLVSMNRVAHDGMRVRAHAGAASFRRRETLEQLVQDAQAQVQALKLEVGDDPGAGTRRVRAARQRAATECEQRIERAIKTMDEIDKSMAGKSKKRQADTPPVDTTHDQTAQAQTAVQDQPTGEQTAEQQSIEPAQTKRSKKPKEPRVSSTDHEARVMKMPDGGFRPAFNAQIAVDTATMIITGVDLITSGSDMNQMLPMHEQHQERYARVPGQWLTDGGFAKHDQIEQLEAHATKVFAPVVAPKDKQRDRYAALPGDSKALAQWRERMGTDEAKQIYKERAASIECANAHLRNRGLQRFNVRGLSKARAVLLWHALAHNLKRMMALNFAFAA